MAEKRLQFTYYQEEDEKMQKKVFSGIKGGLAVLFSLMLALCLVSTAAAKKHSNKNNQNQQNYNNQNLPNGRPFQLLEQYINQQVSDLQDAINNLQSEVDALQSQTGQIQVVTLDSTGGTYDLPITLPSGFSFQEGGKDVRFEITFVPTTAAPPADTYIMEALTSSQPDGSINFIGTNSDGSATHGNATTFPAPIATIDFPGSTSTSPITASLAASTDNTTYEITQSNAPAGTYYVKIIY